MGFLFCGLQPIPLRMSGWTGFGIRMQGVIYPMWCCGCCPSNSELHHVSDYVCLKIYPNKFKPHKIS
jgi:hypothetical protein